LSNTNARRPVKGFEDADFNLVFFFKETNNYPLGLGPRVRWHGPQSLNLSLLWRHAQKGTNPKPLFF